MRPKSLILIVIALGCGLVASIGISQVIENRSGDTAVAPTEKIYVAIADVAVGEPLNAQMVKLEEWPKDKIPLGAVRKLEDIEGRRPLTRLFPGEPILQAKLAGLNQIFGASEKIPKGQRVVSVKVTMDSSASGLLKPGDKVDVLVFLKGGRGISMTQTKTILKDVTVFAINDRITRDVEDDEASIKARTVSLLATPEQVEKIMLASELGKIKLSLRRSDDETPDSALGATIADLDADTGTDHSTNSEPANASNAGSGGLSAFLNGLDVQQEPAKPSWVMHVHTPGDVQVYNWDDSSSLPRELIPAAASTNRVNSGDFAGREVSADSAGGNRGATPEVDSGADMVDTHQESAPGDIGQ